MDEKRKALLAAVVAVANAGNVLGLISGTAVSWLNTNEQLAMLVITLLLTGAQAFLPSLKKPTA